MGDQASSRSSRIVRRRTIAMDQPIWRPAKERIERANMTAFARAVAAAHGERLRDHAELRRWSVERPELFWPIAPVWRGELQTRGLGMAAEVWNDAGEAVAGEPGELVCTRPFPSMPVGFWYDQGGSRYRSAYFARFPGVPRHVPAKIVPIADIPRTMNNKLAALAVREVIHGRPVENLDALANPESLELYRDLHELTT